MNRYSYTVEGAAADGQTYVCCGQVQTEEFTDSFMLAMRAAFGQLTQGKAQYGKPGVGCRGPYTITRVVLEAVPE